ncbi:hypothetical protein TCAL_04290 [Tigriopus californicus]|uniref:AMP-dependent synthetase/ligase domain-containing protein n=1 Tax=Tigriopus californicus TaxID=6832 RepID=A0A553NE57_TIGCA|nr:hypothetical protein TCAL_04290 [Tigriopus californicus]|eukprot:TCALIF_04290-PA protein Name:"Similar to Luciferin 4-monooxygenase (Photinus pyralis)" AED:0.05 eAED:0.05 QI:47/0.87/1/1/1/1/9/93/535
MTDPNRDVNGKNRIKDRVLTSGLTMSVNYDPVQGSMYQEIERALEMNIQEDKDWVVLHNVLTGEKLSGIDALNYGKRFGAFLEQRGFKIGQVVHLILGNHNMTFPICFGAWILGGCISSGDVNLEPRSLSQQLNSLSTRFLICTPDTKDLAVEALNMVDRPQDIQAFCLGPNDMFEDLSATLKNIDSIECPDPVDVDTNSDVPIVFWSSGTTGHPKAICHTHFSALRMAGVSVNFLTPKTNVVTTTCFFHMGGFFAAMLSFVRHLSCYHMFGPDFQLEHLLNTIVSAKPKSITIGTHHYVQLAESELLANANPEDLASLEYIAPAGAAVPRSCAAFYHKMCPNLKVENIATGEGCCPYEEGELCYKTPVVMKGYHNRAKENAAFFDHEGYAHSGDLVYYTPDGDIHYVDRLKEIIKYKNNHVAPTELEDIMQRHPAVQECLVFGKPNDEVQELISAVVVLKPGQKVSAEDLRSFVNNEVTDYKKIRGQIILSNHIPRNSMGKLVRREMREWARHQGNPKDTDIHAPILSSQMLAH